MLLIGLAAALLMRVSDDGGIKAFIAKTDPSKQAYLACLTDQAAKRYKGKDSDALARQILAACTGKLDTLVDAVVKAKKAPDAKDAVNKALQPQLPGLAHQAVKLVAQRAAEAPKPTSKPEEPSFVTIHAPPPDPEDVRDNGHAAADAPAGACGGISTPADPSALTCR